MNFKYYNTDRLIIFILTMSIVYNYISVKIETFISKYEFFKEIYSYIGMFSTITLITTTILLIDRIGWKYKLFNTWLIDIPNLNGRYKGELISTYQSSPGVYVTKIFVMEIKQTASKLHIYSFFGELGNNSVTSTSISVSEQLTSESNNTTNIFYIFTNETAPLLNLNNHLGTGKLKYFKDIKKLEGEYYNQRGNSGKIEVVYEQDKLLGRLN